MSDDLHSIETFHTLVTFPGHIERYGDPVPKNAPGKLVRTWRCVDCGVQAFHPIRTNHPHPRSQR